MCDAGREGNLVAMYNIVDQDLPALSALACQKLLLIALEQQIWYTAASFALSLCKAMPEEAAAGLAIALLGARHTETDSEATPPATPQQAQHLQDSPLFAEMAEFGYQMQQHDSSSTNTGGQQALSRKGVVHIVTHLRAKVQCTLTYIVIKVHCNVKLHCMPSYSALQGTLHAKTRCISRYFAHQDTLHFKVHCMPDYVVIQKTLHFKVQCMPSVIAFQGTLHGVPARHG